MHHQQNKHPKAFYGVLFSYETLPARAVTNTRRPQCMTTIIGDIPFMHDALASIGVQGYTEVLFGAEVKPYKP